MSEAGRGERTDVAAARLLHRVARGGARFERVVVTENRSVVASVVEGGRTLRVSRLLVDAPGEVQESLGRALGTRRGPARREASRRVRSYLRSLSPPPRTRPRSPPRPRPADRAPLEALRAEFDAVNRTFFRDRLPSVPLRLCGRMRRRNGHFSADPLEIAISRRLCAEAEDGEALHTLRHEMIHLWQWIEGRKPGHGGDFRRWAERLGIHPRATRAVCWRDPAA